MSEIKGKSSYNMPRRYRQYENEPWKSRGLNEVLPRKADVGSVVEEIVRIDVGEYLTTHVMGTVR